MFRRRHSGTTPRPPLTESYPSAGAVGAQSETVWDLYPGPKPSSAQEIRAEEAERRLGDRNAFLVVENQIHFHPNLATFGGFGFLVLTRPSNIRGPGVYFMDRAARQWVRAYEIEELPPGIWMQPHDWNGFAVPCQLYLINPDQLAARWIDGNGRSLPPQM